MNITSVDFKNIKSLRKANLPIGRVTLIVGANGSGKSTAIEMLSKMHTLGPTRDYISVGVLDDPRGASSRVDININISGKIFIRRTEFKLSGKDMISEGGLYSADGGIVSTSDGERIYTALASIKFFQFDPTTLSKSNELVPFPVLDSMGGNLVAVLDSLRDSHPEQFERMVEEFGVWFPEYDRILFSTPAQGHRAFMLRTKVGKHSIKASQLSQGTLLALAFLTIAYLPNPPFLVCFEEPEHGVHPYLLRHIKDAMYRLAYPKEFGEDRSPTQVIATTHSPYLLDLFRDHPEDVVIADKDENGAHFTRLLDMPNFDKIFSGEALGELWYSGIFGGVPKTL